MFLQDHSACTPSWILKPTQEVPAEILQFVPVAVSRKCLLHPLKLPILPVLVEGYIPEHAAEQGAGMALELAGQVAGLKAGLTKIPAAHCSKTQ